jgi:hypothetical protein
VPEEVDEYVEAVAAEPSRARIRTDFSDDGAWEAICAAILQLTEEGFGAQVEFVDDAPYRGVTKEQLLNLVPDSDQRPFFMIVDDVTVRSPEHPVLVVDLWREPGREFRAVPTAVQAIQNILSIANMDFAGAVDEDGTFRGF